MQSIMKRVIILLLLFLPLSLVSAKSYKKLIKEYDVIKYLPQECDRNPSTFWESITENNEDFQSIMMKFENPKGSAKKAIEKIKNAVSISKIFRDDFTESEEGFSETYKKLFFGDGDSHNMKFKMTGSNEWNAYSTPDGYVYINYGIAERLESDFDMLIGVVAHEIAHYAYNHMLIHEYKSLKTEKYNNISAAIGAAGTAVGNMITASAGVQKDYSKEEYTQWFDKAGHDSELARYKYSREEETEADIIAYRFLEWIGSNPTAYINALNLINLDALIATDPSYRDHPTTEDRIALLKQLQPAPWREE